MKKPKIVLLSIVCLIITLMIGFKAGGLYIYTQLSEENRCKQFNPYFKNYDSRPCIKAGCRAYGNGEWSCNPKWYYYF